MKGNTSNRNNIFIPVEVSPETRDALSRIGKDAGLTKRDLLARAVDWFAAAGPTAQHAILRPAESAPDAFDRRARTNPGGGLN